MTTSDLQPPLPSLVTGGPCHALLRRLRLLAPDDLPDIRAAAIAGLLIWSIGAVLALLQCASSGDTDLLAYFLDASPVAHAIVALPVMIGMERAVNDQLRALLSHPLQHGLVPSSHAERWRSAVAQADRRSGSALAEWLMAASAVTLCLSLSMRTDMLGMERWSRIGGDSGMALSWAGVWTHVVVGSLFVFLVLRWLLRFIVWTILLWELGRLPLRLIATHPDRAAGLGFIANYPTLFVGLVLGVGAAIGAKLLNAVINGDATSDSLTTVIGLWVAVVLVVFVGPVLLYAPKLSAFRNESLMKIGALGLEANRTLTDDLSSRPCDPALQTSLSALSAINKLHDRVDAIQPLMVTRSTVLQLVILALLPMLPALISRVPMSMIIDVLLGKVI